MRSISLLLCGVLVATVGCANPSYMRTKAAALENTVASYHSQQRDRVDLLNKSYRDTFAQLMDDLTQLSEDELNQEFDLDAQRNADLLLWDWEETTLLHEVVDLFYQTTALQRQRIQQADAALSSARTNYASSYQEVALQLAKLEKVEADLRQLSHSDEVSHQTLEVLKTLANAVEQEIKKQNRPTQPGQAQTPAGRP
jgi:hypothetical protein